MEWILGILLIFFLLKSNLLTGIVPSSVSGGGANLGPSTVLQTPTGPVAEPINTTYVPPQPFNPQPFQAASGLTSQATQAATSAASNACQGSGGSGGACSAATAIPIAGAAIQAIIGLFMAQSQKRAAEARDENSAIAAAVPQWDQWIQQIVNAYNNGQITASDVSTGLDSAIANFWAICQPHVQPGRGGCFLNGQFWTQAQAHQYYDSHGGNPPSDWGGSCVVAYADLGNSVENMNYAVGVNWNTNKPTPAQVLAVYPSKYGGISRPAYTVTFAKPA